MRPAKNLTENLSRIEPARLETASEAIADALAALSAAGAMLGSALHPGTAANLAASVRIMNTYYSNLIEGHNTRPEDIERALTGQFDRDQGRRNLQLDDFEALCAVCCVLCAVCRDQQDKQRGVKRFQQIALRRTLNFNPTPG